MSSPLHQGRLPLPARLSVIALLAFTALRIALLVRSLDSVPHDALVLAGIFARGLLFDATVAAYVFGVFSLSGVLVPERLRTGAAGRHTVHTATAVFLFALGFVLEAEWLFWDEFGVRFNFIAVDYLIYRREVIGNISESYPLATLLGTIAVISVIATVVLHRTTGHARPRPSHLRARLAAAGSGAVAIAVAALVSGDHVPALTRNMYVEEVARNGVFQFFYAFRHNQLDYDKFYRMEDTALASRLLKENVTLPGETLLHPDVPFDITRRVEIVAPERHLNVMLITVESLSGDYMAAFGSKDNITPELDKLAHQSLFFTRYYATGNRTVRGLEAVTLGIPPTPGSAVVRRENNGNLFSLASVLNAKGYDSKFIYGGYGYFDNMNAFFSGNGYQVVDRTDFADDEKKFGNVWGVADEYLYLRALREADKSHAQGKPFFSLVMTTSNHRPYTFPEGRVDGQQKKWTGAVRYTDWAIANFIREARKHPWFDDTIFVIGADHCAGSAGKDAVPLDRYHIPLVIYAPRYLKPRTVDQVASQMDLPATILGLLNMDYTSRFFGRDILRTPREREQALVATYQRMGFYKDNALVILSPQHQVELRLDPLGKDRTASAQDDAAVLDTAIAYYQGADRVLRTGLFTALPPAAHAQAN